MRFAIVGIAFPLILNYLAPLLASYFALPSLSEIWIDFIIFGALFAAFAYLASAYSKGEYPWLLGRLGGGLLSLGFYYFLFTLFPTGALGGGSVLTSGLLILVYLAMGLSYGYLTLDFLDARRNLKKNADAVAKMSQSTPTAPVTPVA